MSYCPMGTVKKVTPQQKGKSRNKKGRRGHHWQKMFKEVGGQKIKIGRSCKNCGKKVFIPELRGT